jgi:energy-converting hydrogenase Eha subunit C
MSSQKATTPRPWYCADSLTDEYLDVARAGENLKMIKTIKAIQSLIANIGVIALGAIGILYASGNATYIVVSAIITLGLLNGVMAVDYASIAQAIIELSPDVDASNNDDGDDSD